MSGRLGLKRCGCSELCDSGINIRGRTNARGSEKEASRHVLGTGGRKAALDLLRVRAQSIGRSPFYTLDGSEKEATEKHIWTSQRCDRTQKEAELLLVWRPFPRRFFPGQVGGSTRSGMVGVAKAQGWIGGRSSVRQGSATKRSTQVNKGTSSYLDCG